MPSSPIIHRIEKGNSGVYPLQYEKSGQGPALFLIHGWPFHSASYRKVLPLLEPYFTCYNVRSAALTDNSHDATTDLSFGGHAQRIIELAEHLNIEAIHLLAHDTGASIARMAAAQRPKLFNRCVLLNTEMPRHRPPFIPLYQKLMHLPIRSTMGALFSIDFILKSPMGYGELFYDNALLNDEFKALFIHHWMNDKTRFKGLADYLKGLNFNDIDKLDTVHKNLQAPTLFVWGKQDKTFPAALGKQMAATMPSCQGFVEVEEACFVVHEEKPDAVAQNCIEFLLSDLA